MGELLDFVERLEVVRVEKARVEHAAAHAQRHDAVAAGEVGRNHRGELLLDRERVLVVDGHVKLARNGAEHFGFRDDAGADEVLAQTQALFAGVPQSVLQCVGGDEAGGDELLAEAHLHAGGLVELSHDQAPSPGLTSGLLS